MKVLAFEGNPKPTDGITYGAAAVELDGKIINAVTRLECPRDRYDYHVEQGTLVPLPNPLDLYGDHNDSKLFVAMLDSQRGIPDYIPKALLRGAVDFYIGRRWNFYVYRDFDALQVVTSELGKQLLADAEKINGLDCQKRQLARWAVVLDSSLLDDAWRFLKPDFKVANQS